MHGINKLILKIRRHSSFYIFCLVSDTLSLDTFDDHRFVLTSGMSILAIVLGTQLGLLNRILDTVGLNLHEWLICIVAPLTIVIACEIRKLIRSRNQTPTETSPTSTNSTQEVTA